MNKLIYLFFALLLFISSCKKDKKPDDINNTENLLTDPATGWKRVAVIPFDELKTARGTSPYNRMKGFDLQKVGGQFAVLYAQHSLDLNNRLASDWFFKALVTENATVQPEKINFGAFSSSGSGNPGPYGKYTFYAQFLPGNSTPVFTGVEYTNNHTVLVDQTSKVIAGTPSRISTFGYLPDGEFLAGTTPLNGSETHLWHYKNPPNPLGDFNYTYRPSTIDGNKRLFTIPIKGADGNYYEFALCSKNGANTFMVIRCREDRPYGATPPNYEVVDSGPLSGMPQSGLSADSLIPLTYEYNSTTGELTFVFEDYLRIPTEVDNRYKNIYAYRWKQGLLTKLWQTSAIESDGVLQAALTTYSNVNRLNDWRLKADGTLYLMDVVQSNSPQNGDAALKLWEVNGSGIKVISSVTHGQTVQKEYTISTCRYIDGAYYALAFPTGDSKYSIGDPHYHMELIKLNP
ncbi:hypothetical protein [Pedobacter heparinus]|uniref:hypothetical protein n=1 Tax=Pedobacter heparinus TaxID=984 RepID=UPI00292E20CD|nr:hypothetical protein [Pedobacter heparinus]